MHLERGLATLADVQRDSTTRLASPVEVARRHIEDGLANSSRPAISCSFQPGGLALLHLLGDSRTDVPVLFVDTGYHFQETLEFMHRMTDFWGLDVRVLTVANEVRRHERHLGPLHATNPDLCCQFRKTDPLFSALEDHDLWITGLRRSQSASRQHTEEHERRLLKSGQVIDKVNPIVGWSDADLDAYTAIHEIPRHPMLSQGFPSIGCAPCTALPTEGDDRSGRWEGGKVECGLHTQLGIAGAE